MDRVEVIRTIILASGPVIGAVIGAIVAVVAIWAKDSLESKKNSQSWFEQVYISEGIDRLLGYLTLHEVQLVVLRSFREAIATEDASFPSVENFSRDVSPIAFPVEALVRVETLLGTCEYKAVISTLPEFTRFYGSLRPETRSQVTLSEKIDLVRNAYMSLVAIRQELLGIKIKRKSDVHAVYKNKLIAKTVARFAEEARKWNERTGQRDQMISLGL